MEYNTVLIAGNLGADPELKYTGNGAAVCNARMAIVAGRKKLSDGTYEEKTAWIDVEMWEKNAENFCNYFNKGDNVLIEGRLDMDEWTDKQTGKKRSKIKVFCYRWQFTSKKGEGGQSDGGGRRPQEQSREQRQRPERERAPARRKDSGADEPFDIGDDEVPF